MQKFNSTPKLPNGEAVREFYISLSIIEEYYWEKGYRKQAYLYRTLKEKLNWKMSLEAFKYHFRKVFNKDSLEKKNVNNLLLEKVEDNSASKTLVKDDNDSEPKVVTIELTPIVKIRKNTRAKRESI